jgi:hypothetical protein
MLLTTSVVKFVFGIGIFAAGLQQQFADKLPIFVVTPFAYALPFIGHLREEIGMPPLIHTVRHVGYTVRELIRTRWPRAGNSPVGDERLAARKTAMIRCSDGKVTTALPFRCGVAAQIAAILWI